MTEKQINEIAQKDIRLHWMSALEDLINKKGYKPFDIQCLTVRREYMRWFYDRSILNNELENDREIRRVYNKLIPKFIREHIDEINQVINIKLSTRYTNL
jgi:hypothetical protein